MENIEPRTDGDHIVAQALETALGSKVEKEPGMGLSSNDYTAAEKAKLAGLENFSLPTFTYRNLCCNSRGDNFNCWAAWSGADKVVIDATKFGRPVIKFTNQYQGGLWWFGMATVDNCPELMPYLGTNVPLPRPVTVSYDMWCNYAVEVSCSESAPAVSIVPNGFQRVKHTIPAGAILPNVGIGVGCVTERYDLEAYYENVQVEWGTEATPYCYNATLPMSLEEQLVPGEFWDGKQVYVRSFKGTTPGNTSPSHVEILLMTGVTHVLSFNASCILSDTYTDSIGMEYIFRKHAGSVYFYIQRPIPEDLSNKPYTAIFKYTKS